MPRTKKAKFQAEDERYAPLRPLTEKQGDYIKALTSSPQVVVMGPAGTGKTYIPGTIAADCYRTQTFNKIILTRPNVPAGRSIGFFPGTLEEKMANWVVPFTTVMKDRLGEGAYEIAVKRGDIEVVPFEVMRGRSWENTFIVLDEAQNTTLAEMKMFLTRQGEGSKTVINGDIRQSDLKEDSGLTQIIRLIKRHKLPVPIIEFGVDDIVRSGICKQWVETFVKEGL